MVGGLLIALASLGVFVTAQGDDGAPSTLFATVTADLEPGQILGLDDIAMVPLDLPPAQAARGFRSADELAGAYTVGPLRAGDLISDSVIRVSPIGEDETPAHRRISLALDQARAVNGDLSAGDRVDLLATSGNGSSARTDVLIRNALVLGASRDGQDRFGAEGTIVVTLAVERGGEVLAAVHASEAATITLVEANQAGDNLPPSFRLPEPGDRVVRTLEEAAE